MVTVEVLIKDIETDPSGQTITLTVEATIGETVEEIRISEMIGNLRGMTDVEVRQHFKMILKDVIRQKIGEREELTPEKIWKRTQDYIGATFTIEVE